MQHSLYHAFLRVSALTLALVLLFVSGVLSPATKQLSDNATSYLGNAIGMHAAVLPTEINTLSAQLQERDAQLTAREIEVNLKEKAITRSDTTVFILSILLFVLLVLIVLNYVLDFLRERRPKLSQNSHEQTA